MGRADLASRSLLPRVFHSSRAARAAALCRACCRKPDSRDTAARDATHVRLHREGAHSPAQEQMKTNLSWLLQLHQLSATRRRGTKNRRAAWEKPFELLYNRSALLFPKIPRSKSSGMPFSAGRGVMSFFFTTSVTVDSLAFLPDLEGDFWHSDVEIKGVRS